MNTALSPNTAAIEPRQLHDLIQTGRHIELIDVRTPAEFREVHIPFARNVPLDRLDPAAVRGGLADPAQPVHVVCRSGNRAAKACEQLAAAGLDVINVAGGTQAWEQAGLPVTRGKKTISLERQVRIAAGTLVLIGIALGAFVHPALYGLAAFVGAGLVFAGITDTCGMGLLLARMPWNQVRTLQSVQAAGTCGPTSTPCSSHS
jgi:rhodanese-related sulfurtransferase